MGMHPWVAMVAAADDVAEDLGTDARELLLTGGRIALIIVVALVVRFILIRAIRRLTRRSAEGESKAMIGALRRHANRAFSQMTGLAAERRRQRADTIGSVLRSVTSITIFTISVVLILGELGIDLGPIIVSAGVAGVALGFGAQNLVRDYLNGISMLLEDQYGVGDVVNFGDISGTIEAVGLRITQVRDVEGVTWYIRNGEVLKVGNMSQGTASVVVDVPVAHGTDLARAQEILTEVVGDVAEDENWSKRIVGAPQVLGVQTVTPVGITFRVTIDTVPAARWSLARDVRRRVTTALDAAGIRSPMPAYTPTEAPEAEPGRTSKSGQSGQPGQS